MPGKSYRAWYPDQPFLLPPSPGEWLPEDHIARFVLELVRELDITAIETTIQSKDPRGERPYDPRMMMGLLVYGYCTGVMSSRKLSARLRRCGRSSGRRTRTRSGGRGIPLPRRRPAPGVLHDLRVPACASGCRA